MRGKDHLFPSVHLFIPLSLSTHFMTLKISIAADTLAELASALVRINDFCMTIFTL